MSSFNLKKSRNSMVAKDNRMIQNSRMSLGLLENKAVLYLISKIKPEDEHGKTYIFNCREFQALLNWNQEASYQNVKIMLQNLGDISWWIESEIKGRKKDVLVRWFNVVHMDPGNGDIEISFHEDMFPFLLDLKRQSEENKVYFTTFKLQNVILMKHRYSPRIYELLKSYQYNNKKWTFENGTGSEYDLQRRIADTVLNKKTREGIPMIPKSWSNWAVFKRDVLDPAVEEINKYTDIKVAYEGKKEDIYKKKTRAIRTIQFYMARKTELEQKETDSIIDTEYILVDDQQANNKMSIEELFFQEHEKSIEKERAEKEIFVARKIEEKIQKSKHPILFAELNDDRKADFDEKKVNQLYQAAIKERVVGEINSDQWEMFATDLVLYYYDKIMSTPEDTISTTFNRLLDSVTKDYDRISFTILEQYKK